MGKYFEVDKYGSLTVTKAFPWLIAKCIMGLFLIMVLFSSIVSVNSGTVGVITTFGKVTGEFQPGVHLKIPFIQSTNGIDVQIQKEQVDAEAATNDLQNVTSTVALNYHLDHGRVSDVFVNLTAKYKDNIISPVLQESVKSVTSQYTAADLLQKRAEVTTKIQTELVNKLEPRGILIDQFSIVNFAFSPEYTKAIEAKQVAQQNAEGAKYTLQQAQLTAQANQAQTAALTESILEQQAISKWNGVLPLYVGQGSIFNIPLSK